VYKEDQAFGACLANKVSIGLMEGY